jgi:hypothetical protein
MDTTEKSPEILHISYRESCPDNEYKWLYVVVTFKVFDEFDSNLCDGYCSEYQRNILYEVEDVKDIHRHYLSTEFKFKNIKDSEMTELVSVQTDPEHDISQKIKRGWTNNPFQILNKAKKPGVYFYRGYVEDNAVTRGALQLLQELKNKGSNNSRFVSLSTINRSLMALDTFWD